MTTEHAQGGGCGVWGAGCVCVWGGGGNVGRMAYGVLIFQFPSSFYNLPISSTDIWIQYTIFLWHNR